MTHSIPYYIKYNIKWNSYCYKYKKAVCVSKYCILKCRQPLFKKN